MTDHHTRSTKAAAVKECSSAALASSCYSSHPLPRLRRRDSVFSSYEIYLHLVHHHARYIYIQLPHIPHSRSIPVRRVHLYAALQDTSLSIHIASSHRQRSLASSDSCFVLRIDHRPTPTDLPDASTTIEQPELEEIQLYSKKETPPTMFEHFTFCAQPQIMQPSHLLDDAFPSPTDTSFPSPLTPPPSSSSNPQHQAGISDIIAKFSQQTLQQQSRDQLVHDFQTWQRGNDDAATFAPPEIGDDDVDIEDTDQDDILPNSERITKTVSLLSTPVSPPPPSSLACRRLQRQLNVQLQTSTTHSRDIGALVDGMVASESQCTLRQSTSTYCAHHHNCDHRKIEIAPRCST